MGGEGKSGAEKVICFDCSKRETYSPQSGFKSLRRKLQGNYKITINKDEITLEHLREANLVIFAGPREKFSTDEFDAMKAYLQEGGSILVTLGEGGEQRFGTNINYFTEEYGIAVNSDAVVRTVYYKYLHPKEVHISNGVLNREINIAAGKKPLTSNTSSASAAYAISQSSPNANLCYAYPYGASLSVAKPAFSVLSSGYIAYPLNRPTCAVFHHKSGPGRLCVMGSTDMFSDAWVDKDENGKLCEILVKWLMCSEDINMDVMDAEEPDVSDYHHLPDTEALAERVRCCLQESEEVTKDFTTLFDDSLFRFDTSLIPEAVQLYRTLDVKHEPLSLIPPQFETPLPPLAPAVFPPSLREPPPPALDLFDLDEQFASEKVRLAHLANKCNDDDLEYYIRESGDILGVTGNLKPENKDARHVLEHIFKQICAWKKLNVEPEAMKAFKELNNMP